MTSSASPPFGLYMLDVLIEGTDICRISFRFQFPPDDAIVREGPVAIIGGMGSPGIAGDPTRGAFGSQAQTRAGPPLRARGALLPATSQGPIEIDEGEQFLQAQLGLGQLSLKEVALGAEHLQVAIDAALVAKRRKVRGFG